MKTIITTKGGVLLLFCSLAALLSVSVFARAQETNDAIPPEVSNNTNQWPMANHNYSNTRTAGQSTITSENVNGLGVAWAFPIPGGAQFGAAASAPLIADNIVYFQDLSSNVFALNLEDGSLNWQKLYDNDVIGPNGPAIGYGRVYISSGVDTFAALDMESGEEVWSVDTQGRPTGAIQPYVYDNKVYITTQAGVGGEGETSYRGYAGGTSGFIYALDVETGETLWEFQTVTDGFWGNEEVNSGGGVWFSPAIDTNTGTTFWGTGNPAPFPGTVDYPNASSRPEPNLYANSVIALNPDGELDWYKYLNPNDLFDLDLQSSPILTSALVNNVEEDILIASGKVGVIYGLTRDDGQLLWQREVGIHMNDNLDEIPIGEVVRVYPGTLGGVETPMAYVDGVVYAPVLNLWSEHEATSYGATTGTEALSNVNTQEYGQGTSEIVALNAATGDIYWSTEFGVDNYAGVTVVNDLVFTATYDGMIYALDRFTGDVVWRYESPVGINAWPAVAGDTIIWPAGAGQNPVLIALRLGATGTVESAMTESPPEEDVIAEDDTETPEATETPEDADATEATETPEDTDATEDTSLAPDSPAGTDVEQIMAALEGLEGDANNGGDIYNASAETGIGSIVNCASCHVGGSNGPALEGFWSRVESDRLSQDRFSDYTAEQYTIESIVQPDAYIVGGYREGIMPDNYGETLTVQDLADIIAFLRNH